VPGVERARAITVAVVGAGASGVLTAAQLLRQAAGGPRPLAVALVGPTPDPGRGAAYGTRHPAHLLNVRVERMSAFPDEPDHLFRWGAAQGLALKPGDFIPRSLYGSYLEEVLHTAAGAASGASLVRLTGAVTAIEDDPAGRGLILRLNDRASLRADAAVLAIGNAPPQPLEALDAAVRAHPAYVADPWSADVSEILAQGLSVACIGTGLTAVDVALTAADANPATVVHLVSRHGLLPLPHAHVPAPDQALVDAMAALGGDGGPLALQEVLRALRAEARVPGRDWRIVVDACRPHMVRWWRALSAADRQRFLERLARIWDVHRHRMPPEVRSALDGLRAAGRLHVHRATIVGAAPAGRGLDVRLAARGGDGRPPAARHLQVGLLFNCTGPSADPARSGDPLVRQLLGSGRARPDALRMGFATDERGALLDAAGAPSRSLFTLGPTRRGELLETTAIPEIRVQASELAGLLLERLRPAEARPMPSAA
jgi:uncharacterized NAD(P)/FAD-binding protein YdhS